MAYDPRSFRLDGQVAVLTPEIEKDMLRHTPLQRLVNQAGSTGASLTPRSPAESRRKT